VDADSGVLMYCLAELRIPFALAVGSPAGSPPLLTFELFTRRLPQPTRAQSLQFLAQKQDVLLRDLAGVVRDLGGCAFVLTVVPDLGGVGLNVLCECDAGDASPGAEQRTQVAPDGLERSDFSLRHAVLYTGLAGLNLRLAQLYCRCHPTWATIHDTPGGRLLRRRQLLRTVPLREFCRIETEVSAQYAERIEGDCHTFVAGAGPERIFRAVELVPFVDNEKVASINGEPRSVFARILRLKGPSSCFEALVAAELRRDAGSLFDEVAKANALPTAAERLAMHGEAQRLFVSCGPELQRVRADVLAPADQGAQRR